jgi:acyl-homoserine lactone synthase
MIHIVTSANRAAYEAQIEEMFRLRYDFYVKERGWKDLDRPDGREIDEYDDERTVYLLHLDEKDHVDGAYRLYPTDVKCLMKDKFAHLVENGSVPGGPDIYEITRLFMSKEARRAAGAARSSVGAELNAALMEFAVRRRISSFNLVCDTFFLPRLLAAWKITPLGLPQKYPEGEAVAVTISVGPEEPQHTRRFMGVSEPVTFEAPTPWDRAEMGSPSLAGRWAEALEGVRDEDVRCNLVELAEALAAADRETAIAGCRAARTRLTRRPRDTAPTA